MNGERAQWTGSAHGDDRGMNSICFVAHRSYGCLQGGSTGHPGGVERQTSLMAHWLAARGFNVSVLTWDEGQPQDETIGGVRVIKMCGSQEGLPVVRFVHPRWTSLNTALARANAALYYHNCGEYVTGQVALWCKRHDRKLVYSIASDPDCDPRLPHMPRMRERVLYRYGLRNADSVIVQTETQQSMLRAGYGIQSSVFPMPCPGPGEAEFIAPSLQHNRKKVLWVGRLTAVKRLDWLIEIARLLPHIEFVVAGPVVEDDVERVGDLAEFATKLPNVELLGHVARERMPDLYRNSALLCCTSVHEGFPNTFLEAWSYGVPVVSTVDPDSLIRRNSMGAIGKSPKELAESISRLLGDERQWSQASMNARQYYLSHHMFEPAMQRFENLFLQMMGLKQKAARTS